MRARTRSLWFATITAAFIAAGCSTTQQVRLPDHAVVTLQPGDASVGTYVAKPRGFSTSSYWIEGPQGLIVVDTQFLLSSAEELINWAEFSTGKRVVAGLVLHPNPDKFNGVEVFKKRGIPVYTSEQVRMLIPTVHEDRHHWFYERFKPDYPNSVPLPESFGNKTQTLSYGGVELKAHVLGAGCSEAHVVVEHRKHVFVGDLVASLHHSWLEIGKIDEWLKRLDYIQKLEPEYVHPGRGPSGGPELLTRQIAYLKKVKELILKERPRGEPNEAAIARVQRKLEELYTSYGHEYFLEIGLPAVWAAYAK
ncbi:MAG TPA: MBL fold metallo-hydrolase [Bdellovibrionales bacterium]|nr:MBL fold metallo-hydrolase [Bdellovibrionales bacterium]